ncbi:MAG: DNA polymerase III subunit delta [Bryobacteraceae bacterium]
MTPDQFLAKLKKDGPEPVYLFLGPEAFERERCRRALFAAALPEEAREDGFTRHGLDQIPLAAAIDDARSMSLFAQQRLIWLASAEAAVPRTRASSKADDEEDSGAATDVDALTSYIRQPTPGTVLVIDCSRYDFDGEDKTKLERVQKFFAAVPSIVEFRPFSPEAARALAQRRAKELKLQLGLAELAILLDVTGGDAARLMNEIEKLSLYAGTERKVTAEDIGALVAEAHSSTIFALVAAIGRGDRTRALEILDTLSREGEYMPLALTFLSTQFRMALTARAAGLKGAGQIQAHFTKLGARIWPARAQEIAGTVDAFPKAKLEKGIGRVFAADRDLRDARPDDRIVMEEMILALTAKGTTS